MTTGFYSYSHSFLFTHLRWHGGYGALTVMFLTLWTLAAACCVWVITRSCHSQRLRKERRFWGATGLVSVVLMTPLSEPIWRVVPILRQVQFPWRFNGVLAVAATGLLALGVSSIRARRPGPTRVMRAMIGLLALSWVLFTARAIWEAFPEVSPSADKISRRVRQARDAPEYRPRWTPSLREADLERLLLRVGKSGDGLAKVRVAGGAATVVVDLWEPRRIGLRVDTPERRTARHQPAVLSGLERGTRRAGNRSRGEAFSARRSGSSARATGHLSGVTAFSHQRAGVRRQAYHRSGWGSDVGSVPLAAR